MCWVVCEEHTNSFQPWRTGWMRWHHSCLIKLQRDIKSTHTHTRIHTRGSGPRVPQGGQIARACVNASIFCPKSADGCIAVAGGRGEGGGGGGRTFRQEVCAFPKRRERRRGLEREHVASAYNVWREKEEVGLHFSSTLPSFSPECVCLTSLFSTRSEKNFLFKII